MTNTRVNATNGRGRTAADMVNGNTPAYVTRMEAIKEMLRSAQKRK